ncbi:MAG: hypothetical protein WBL67_21485 [Nitrososphaeraceae archaeon]
MARKSTRNMSSLADTNVLLDVLGNETRRRILNLISHEPSILTNWLRRYEQVNK